MYALFIDFKRAFPSICHTRLWNKLNKIGVSGKFIRILKKIYDDAYTVVRTQNGNSEKVQITKGLMQGSVLSPLLFSLYISDIDNVIAKSQIPGVKLKVNLFLHLLMFADDMVLMSSSPVYLQRLINLLQKYFHDLS